MRFTIDGVEYELERETVIGRLRGWPPDAIQIHWVDVEGVRFPVKQALEVALGVSREAFRSHRARSIFSGLGFATSGHSVSSDGSSNSRKPKSSAHERVEVSAEEAAESFGTLVRFLRRSSFTKSISNLERALVKATKETAPEIAQATGLTPELLTAALIVRRDVGRVSDVIHASVITLSLPYILESGEEVANRPSLGPGNDKSRPFDLETNRRVAEFKVALWSGGDMMRKRGVTADLVHLAMDDSGRRPELWVAGSEPLHFLKTSTSPVGSLLSRSSRHLRTRFESKFDPTLPLCEFVATHAAHVKLCELSEVVPSVAAALL